MNETLVVDTSINIPLDLRQALESGNCVLFIGAGVGSHLHKPNGDEAPQAAALASELATHFGIDADGSTDLAKIAQVIEIRKRGRRELHGFLQERLSELIPDDDLRWLLARPWRAIFTTNYDNAIEQAHGMNTAPLQNPVIVSVTADMGPVNPMFEVPVIHLHGRLFGVEQPRIIITEDDYAHFRTRREMLFDLLKKEFASSTILYVGYSHNDTNWKLLLDEFITDSNNSPRPRSYRISPKTSVLDVEILRAKGVETFHTGLDKFVRAAQLELSDGVNSMEQLRRLQSEIPSDLQISFDNNPAPVARLLSSWAYVNQAPFAAKANLSSFLRGDQPNWALVGQGGYFERDLEEELYDHLLDHATSSSMRAQVTALLGSAGYGTSTLLHVLAAKLVKDDAGVVFMHRAGARLLEGDVVFAASLFPDKRTFFFIDNAADVSHAVLDSLSRLRDASRPALLFLGERINEWRIGKGRLNAKEFMIEPLSDPEIWRLLSYLDLNNELNKLEPLSEDLRFAAIKKIHQKELLVAMREATEGTSFDAILEDEFLNLASELAKKMYLTVCCFYQHGALLRDDLLSQLVGVPLALLHSLTSDATEGVVIFDEVDPVRGSFAARARHRTIARIVWERCGDLMDKESLILAAMDALNLNHRMDANAFEQFIRSDSFVDGIHTLDDRTAFFEKAAAKDPDSPYVRQHYARMLTRSGKPELALTQVQKGLELDPDLKVLYHTQGTVLARIAQDTLSTDLARRRMIQAEQAFRKGIAIYSKDEYSYSSLAELYLMWATKVPAQSTDYISKCESVISEGLRVVQSRENLWVVSSRVQKMLGDEPGRVADLKRAIREHPIAVYPRLCLARAQRENEHPEEAIQTLEPVLREHPDEFRLSVEYAHALDEVGGSYEAALASSTYGARDPRYVAVYLGMSFMNKQFTEASRMVSETLRREFAPYEMNTVHYRPKQKGNPKLPVHFEGIVVAVKAGYAFIEVPGYPSFFCPSAKQRNVTLYKGLRVEFTPVFSARGALAERPKPLSSS
ncbi:MAG: SIR2 family protein [Janthinobacterium lividum]